MKRAELDTRTRALAAASARQREELAYALQPWSMCGSRIDRTTQRLRDRAGWIGFLAGMSAGMLATLRPRWLLPPARALVATWPMWRLLRLLRR